LHLTVKQGDANMRIIELKKTPVTSKSSKKLSILKPLKEKFLYSVGYLLYYSILFLNEIYFAIEKIVKKPQNNTTSFFSQEEAFMKQNTQRPSPLYLKIK
jgi:hypothetical protein